MKPLPALLAALVAAGVCRGFVPQLGRAGWIESPPISFRYGGREARALLPAWQRTITADGVGYFDPATGLRVTARIRTYPDSGAIDWVLIFRNDGRQDTPFLDAVRPLDWSAGALAAGQAAIVHHARGSSAQASDFEPLDERLAPGGEVRLESERGLSSSGATLPFFNLELGGGGVIGAIGWTGDWRADFACAPDTRDVRLSAGMKRLHLRLHPGEQIRSPRIVLLPWTGDDWLVAQNAWRRLVLAHYAPRQNGRPLAGPIMVGSWGSEPVASKLELIRSVVRHRLPFDVYAVDAGWYGNSEGLTEPISEAGPHPWWRERGNWWASPRYYPRGLGELGDALAENGLGFSLWVEPETAEPGTRMLVEHPDWYLHVPNAINDGAALLNLGDPAARAGMTELVSHLISTARMTWYRQDFNIPPAGYWARADSPDGIGRTEIRHVEGLYAFWDSLRAAHPGLAIDNCASGGRRLDLEMISRSFNVWRSDYGCADAIAEQMQTQGLSPWVPLNMGVETLWTQSPWDRRIPPGSDADLYRMRGSYSAGFGSDPGPPGTANDTWLAWERRALGEYREAQPFFYGDFYPLLPYSRDAADWTAWQWDRPDLESGIILLLRRPQSPYTAMELRLHAIDAHADYDVEMRPTLEHRRAIRMTGEALMHLAVTLPGRPSSLLIFYRRRAAGPVLTRAGGGAWSMSNPTARPMRVDFEPPPGVEVQPRQAVLPPGGRVSVRLQGAGQAPIVYAVSQASPPLFPADRYPADREGDTVAVIPVEPGLAAAAVNRARDIFSSSRTRVTDPAMPPDTYIYTPSPYYRAAGLFGRDFLFQLEGAGRYAVTADEIKRAVDFMALKQLTAPHVVQGCTFPPGAIPDRVQPDGQVAWGPGPGNALGDRIAGYHRPSMDEAMCFVTLAWHYGRKADWNDAWKQWFERLAPRLELAWQSVPRNPRSGLVTQWTTPGHIGGGGITETTGPCVMWGFHDSYGFPGDDLGTSVLACNAARALADMYDHDARPALARPWAERARVLVAAIRAQFRSEGYLPWGVGPGAPEIASPDITGYAVWSHILSGAQADAASDWLARNFPTALFQHTPGLRGAVRMARPADDVNPGSHVWPHLRPPYWENLTFGYNAYQDGGYWYYMSLGIAVTLWRRHPALAQAWAADACRDLIDQGENYPYERIDGNTPVNFRYNASAGALAGMGRPATFFEWNAASSSP